MFWERACKHYNKSRPLGCMGRPTKPLETKWEIIKHDVSKFVGAFNSVETLCEFKTNAKDVLHKPLKLYKMKH